MRAPSVWMACIGLLGRSHALLKTFARGVAG